MTHGHLRRVGFGGLTAVTLSTLGLYLRTTRAGMGLTSDSGAYLNGATSLKAGHGFTVPRTGKAITAFPPLYSAALRAFAIGATRPLDAARLLNGFLLVATLVLLAALGRRLGAGWVAITLVSGAVALSQPFLVAFTSVWSEALFMPLTLLGSLLLIVAIESRSPASLIGSGLALGAAALTRYSGWPLLAVGCAALVGLGADRLPRQRVRDVAMFAAPFGVVAGPWLVRNWLRSHTLTGRSLALHLPGRAFWTQGVRTIGGWLWPGSRTSGTTAAVAIFAVLTVLGIAAWASRRRKDGVEAGDAPALMLVGMVLVVYLGGVVLARAVADASIPLDGRILLPAQLLVAAMVAVVTSNGLRPRGQLLLGIVAIVVVGAVVADSAHWVDQTAAHRQAEQRAEASLVRSVRRLPAGLMIFSNHATTFALISGRPGPDLPALFSRRDGRCLPGYVAAMRQLRKRLANGEGVVVYLHSRRSDPHYPPLGQLTRVLGLTTVTRTPGGSILRGGAPPTPVLAQPDDRRTVRLLPANLQRCEDALAEV